MEGENGSRSILLGAGGGVCGRSGSERFDAVDGVGKGREGREVEQNRPESGNVGVGARLAMWNATTTRLGR